MLRCPRQSLIFDTLEVICCTSVHPLGPEDLQMSQELWPCDTILLDMLVFDAILLKDDSSRYDRAHAPTGTGTPCTEL